MLLLSLNSTVQQVAEAKPIAISIYNIVMLLALNGILYALDGQSVVSLLVRIFTILLGMYWHTISPDATWSLG